MIVFLPFTLWGRFLLKCLGGDEEHRFRIARWFCFLHICCVMYGIGEGLATNGPWALIVAVPLSFSSWILYQLHIAQIRTVELERQLYPDQIPSPYIAFENTRRAYLPLAILSIAIGTVIGIPISRALGLGYLQFVTAFCVMLDEGPKSSLRDRLRATWARLAPRPQIALGGAGA